MQEKRQTTRIIFKNPIILFFGNGLRINGEVRNLSLRGLYIKVGDIDLFKEGDQCSFHMPLSEEDDTLCVDGKARIIRKDRKSGIGSYVVEIDSDSLMHLRQIVGLNSADPAQVAKELKRFVS